MMRTEQSEQRVICFQKQKREFFLQASKDNIGVSIKKARIQANKDAVISDECEISHIVPTFKNTDFIPKSISIKDLLFKSILFSRVSIIGLVYDMYELSNQRHQVSIKDESGCMLLITENLQHELVPSTVYKFTNVLLSKMEDSRVLKFNGSTGDYEIVDDLKISSPNDNEKLDLLIQTIVGRATAVILPTLSKKFVCRSCNEDLQPDEDGFLECTCGFCSTTETCASSTMAEFTMKEDNEEYPLKCEHSLLEEALGEKCLNQKTMAKLLF